MVMFALVPYLALSSSLGPLTPIIAKQLHMSLQTMSLSSGLGNAAYAVGTVIAVQFAQHLPQRRMLVVYTAMLVTGSVLTAAAQDGGMYIVGHVVQGLSTSLLLIAAVPPLAIMFPPTKLRDTAVIMNMCIFGAVALGPLIGGLQAEAHGWRPLFWIVAAVAAAALVLSVLTFQDAPPANPSSPSGLPVIVLAGVGCVAAFFGASELTSHGFLDVETTLPLLGGLAAIVALVVYQYRAKQPLLTIRTMLTSSIPVAGIVVALFAAAASVSATALTAGVLALHYSPVHVGLLYMPEVGGAVVSAVALGLVIRRRAMHYLPLAGMALLAAGIVVFRVEVPSSQALTLVGSGPDRPRSRRHRRPARYFRGRFLAARLQPPAGLRHRRALPGGCGVYGGADLCLPSPPRPGAASTPAPASPLDRARVRAGRGGPLGVVIYALSGARPQQPDLDRFLGGACRRGSRRRCSPGCGPV